MGKRSNKRILLLGSNFSGNVGDIFIFESVCNFLTKYLIDFEIDVYPYPKRFDSFVALPCINKLEGKIRIRQPVYRLRLFFDHLMRKFNFIEKFISLFYFNEKTGLIRVCKKPITGEEYDKIIVIGGEMDLPYSILDIHSYLKSLTKPLKNIAYGPISITPKKQYKKFLKKQFREVDNFAIRDPLTYERLNKLGINNNTLVPDTAFLAFDKSKFQTRHGVRKKIGLCLHARWGYSNRLSDFINRIASSAKSLNCEIIFFVTNIKEDFLLIDRMNELQETNSNIRMALPTGAKELCDLYSEVDLIISDRLHGLLIGMINGCVLVPLATREKVKGYCQYLSLKDYLHGNESELVIYDILNNVYSNIEIQRNHLLGFMEKANTDVSEYFIHSLSISP